MNEQLTEKQFRVSYINEMDNKRHVLIGKVDRATADSVMDKFGNPDNKFSYMGVGSIVEECDGTPDGEIIKATGA